MTTSAEQHAAPRPRSERGYVALLVAILFPVVFIGFAAVAIDTARWYVTVQQVQNAADAGALGGVTYMPQDLASATAMAKTVTARNGFTDGVNGVSVTTDTGDKASQLKVTVTATVPNTFGQLIGTPTTTISRSATSDFTGPAPMGSPCNTFGNEPSSGGGASSAYPTGTALPAVGKFANCASDPDFWAVVLGPGTIKDNGDRYGTTGCSGSTVDGCAGTTNSEYNPLGYFWVIKVQPAAVGKQINLQLYDPAYVNTTGTCSTLPSSTYLDLDMNPYTKLDGKTRYGNGTADSSTGSKFCTGDNLPSGGGSGQMTTSFEIREQTDTLNPMKGASISGCTKQYTGQTTAPVYNDLKSTVTSTYDQQLAAVFHNWTSLCTFTPARSGDYYLHVRTNVSAANPVLGNTGSNTAKIYAGDSAAVGAPVGNTTSGAGDNAFGIRAVTPAGSENQVSVSGYDRMPIFVNVDAATATFNLIRVLPGAAGQYVSFNFFDVADSQSGSASVKVLPPTDATGSITTNPYPNGCRAVGGYAGATTDILTNCTAPVTSSTNNGKLETMSIPIPTDYKCTTTTNGGCWYRVQVSFPSGTVNDVTTWDAQIVGDPVRLVK